MGNDISLAGAMRMCRRGPPTVQERLESTSGERLSLVNAQLDDAGVDELVRALIDVDTRLAQVTELNVGHNAIGDRGAASLCKALAHAPLHLSALHLSCCDLTDGGVACLAAALQTNARLTLLDLNHNVRVGDSGAAMLEQVLLSASSPCRLHTLSMVATSVSSEGAARLARVAAAGRLHTLLLGGTDIDCRGAQAFAAALQHAQCMLAELALDSCAIGDAGAVALAMVLASPAAASTSVDDEDCTCARERESEAASSTSVPPPSRTPSLRILQLDGNRDIGDTAAQALAAAVASNRGLHTLALASTSIGDTGCAALAAALLQRASDAAPLVLTLDACAEIGEMGSASMAASLRTLVQRSATAVHYSGPGGGGGKRRSAHAIALEVVE